CIANRRIIDLKRRWLRHQQMLQNVAEEYWIKSRSGREESPVREESSEEWIMRAVRDLPDSQRAVITDLLEGNPTASVAAWHGLTQAAVRQQLSRFRKRLAKRLKEERWQLHLAQDRPILREDSLAEPQPSAGSGIPLKL